MPKPRHVTPTEQAVESLRHTMSGVMCQLLGISVSQLQNLTNNGTLPKTRHGEYDAIETPQRHREYLLAGRVPGDLGDTRKALEHERHRKLKLENDRKDGELVPVGDFFATGDAMSSVFVQGMESLPGRLATVLAGESEPAVVRKVMMGEVRRVRQSVSDTFERMAKEQTLDTS